MTELPMFPLGSVLFPSLVLPLHVFESRYRRLVRHCLEGDGEFGVVLIERGSEVGGGDTRTGVGTVARILQAEELDDGRWALAAVGTRRIRVAEWLADDPYPRAEVVDWPDDPVIGDLDDAYRERVALLRRVLALQAELGEAAAPVDVAVSDDPALGSYRLSALSSLGPLDQYGLLAAEGVEHRLERLGTLLADQAELLEARLRLG